ncbi:hypothetical protein [Microbacterium sp. No. 7]|uniref:hypothetical protein n=1 Tax=Microbacterium sp. No. 7 TaxID=1714373 RepID=UPI0006ECE2DF|nr:hypothetical protein [Microbacterium sp. No. 7]ALJ19207.1 hypothetical protein AOA12_04540 [Microbacterium sp. No. 7]
MSQTADVQPDAFDRGDAGAPESPTRRSVVRGAAWSLPVIAAAITVPTAAATTPAPACPSITMGDWSSWRNQGQALVPAGGVNGHNGWFRSHRGLTGFVSMLDSAACAPGSNTPVAYVLTDVTIPVTPGTTYVFTFQGVGGWGNSNDNRNTRFQQVEVRINGITMWSGDTRTNLHPDRGIQSYSFVYVASPGQTGITLTYRFAIPPRPRCDALGANDDIVLTSPLITCS